jgi:transcriptional regulator with XRE-family HTH domain
MILKQLRLSRNLSQDQLAQMSGLNVRTIQRIESGHKASVESLKCIAAALEVDIPTLEQENFVIDKVISPEGCLLKLAG